MGHMPGGSDGGLHKYQVGPRFNSDGTHTLGVLGGESNRAGGACLLDLSNTLPDQVFLYWLGIDLL